MIAIVVTSIAKRVLCGRSLQVDIILRGVRSLGAQGAAVFNEFTFDHLLQMAFLAPDMLSLRWSDGGSRDGATIDQLSLDQVCAALVCLLVMNAPGLIFVGATPLFCGFCRSSGCSL